jgi:predicted Rossmann-fold nucleotide-binding protein
MFTRKFAFLEADGFVCVGYGIGTLDEWTEVLTQIQLGLLHGKPVVCVGVQEWAPMRRVVEGLVKEGKMSPEDLQLFSIVDEPADVLSAISRAVSPLVAAR